MDSTQNIISFCTGYGGIELGLRLAGANVRTVAYVEIEAFAVANLVAKIEQGKMDAAPVWTNLKTFDGRPFRDKVHGIIGGYPCQPFSNAGQRKGTDDPRHLFPYICEHIRTIRPLWCFFENVGGHLNLGFDEVYKSLRDMGYKVEAGLFTAAEVGAPHKRERLFILGYSEGYLRRTSGDDRREPLDRTSAESVANPNMQPDGQNTGGDAETDRVQGIDRQEVCGGGIARAGEQLADSVCKGLQGNKCRGRVDQERRQEQDGSVAECRSLWPARPGQPQYDWEEPRTVKPGMGRTVDGTASRVDELRLLGNGVVPQTAAVAWKTLTKEIE